MGRGVFTVVIVIIVLDAGDLQHPSQDVVPIGENPLWTLRHTPPSRPSATRPSRLNRRSAVSGVDLPLALHPPGGLVELRPKLEQEQFPASIRPSLCSRLGSCSSSTEMTTTTWEGIRQPRWQSTRASPVDPPHGTLGVVACHDVVVQSTTAKRVRTISGPPAALGRAAACRFRRANTWMFCRTSTRP
jgi:hypothetical protein